MGNKINVAKILKDKPRGTKLYSSACGKCKLEEVDDKSFKISFYNSKFGFMNGGEGYLDKNGKLYDDGECVVFPSKEMRDWEKFAWKRGDVLVNSRGLKILFDRWANDNYTSFYAKTINLVEDGFLDTNLHTLASEKEAKSFIKCIEEKLGGKLNRETLEVEKTQPEFKDGDILCVIESSNNYHYILIYEGQDDEHIYRYVTMLENNSLIIEKGSYFTKPKDYSMRYATEEEKQQLFDALAKKDKAWDAEKKMIVDLKKKVELKPFDKVVVRCSEADRWSIDFFSYKAPNGYICTGDAWFGYCLPYNEETAKLIGTTKNMEV